MFSYPDTFEELLSAIISYLPRTGQIVDAGCGSGAFAKKLKKFNDNILCLDLISENDVPLCLGNITSLPIKNNSIDFIYCLSVLQYIEDDVKAINEFYRILKPDGKLFITVPTKWSPFFLIREMEIYFGVYPWQLSWNIRPYQYYSRKMIVRLIENKFDIIEINGYLYNFFPRLCELCLNIAKKNHHFNIFLSELKVFTQRKVKVDTSHSTQEPGVLEPKNNLIRKRRISKISDISFHYIIVLEKRR